MKFYFETNDPVVRWALKPRHFDNKCGIDLIIPDQVTIAPNQTQIIDLKIACQFRSWRKTFPYLLVAKNSINETPLIIKNSVNIIDRNFKGNLKIAIWNTSNEPFEVPVGARFVSILAPSLKKYSFKFVDMLP